MSAIHTKSLTGITSITTPPGVDNVFTVHSNDTTERFRVDLNGNQSIAGILTVSQDLDVDGHTNLDNTDIVGILTVTSTTQYGGYKLSNNSSIVGELVGLSGSNDTGALALWSGGSKYVQLSAIGNSYLTGGSLGIGTISPDSLLHISADSGQAQVRLQRTGAAANGNDYGRIYFESNDNVLTGQISVARESAENNGYMLFKTASGGTLGERLRITSDGKIGINDTSPDSIFSVKDTYIFSCAGGNSTTGMQIGGYDAGANSYNPITVRASQILFSISGTERLRIGSSGQIGIAGANYGSSGQVLTSGGSGSAVSWTTISGTTINNNADNRVITGSGTANTLEGEANLTFTGSQLNITGNISLPDSTAPDYVGNIYVGSSSDLKIFHNGYDNFIRSGAGNHNIRIDNNAGVLGARFIPAGSSELYHNGGLRAYTVSNGFYAEQAEHNDDFDLLIANKFGSLNNNQRCAITCRVTRDAGGSHGGTNRQAVFGHMYNGTTGGGGYYNIRSNDGTNRDFYMDNNTNLRVNYGSNNIGSSNGTVVGSQSSDIRNKNLVGDGTVSYGLSEVLQLNPIKYQYKKELVDRIGFSAQQVEPIIPESVYDTKQDQDNEGNTVSGDTIKAMYYVDLIPVLVNAIKELKAENDALKKRLDDGGL